MITFTGSFWEWVVSAVVFGCVFGFVNGFTTEAVKDLKRLREQRRRLRAFRTLQRSQPSFQLPFDHEDDAA